jgi:hypothetical protein
MIRFENKSSRRSVAALSTTRFNQRIPIRLALTAAPQAALSAAAIVRTQLYPATVDQVNIK